MYADRSNTDQRPGVAFRALKQSADYSLSSAVGIEIVVLFFLLLAIEHLAPGREAFVSLSPHPYWAAVLLLSVRHGTAAGLAAALVAIVLYWLHGAPARIPEEDYYVYTLRIWREPMLWLLVALIVGEIRLGQIEERNSLALALRNAERQRSIIADHWGLLAGHVEDLERGIAAADQTSADAALAALAAFRKARPEEAPVAFKLVTGLLLGQSARTAYWAADADRGGALTFNSQWSRDPLAETDDDHAPGRALLSTIRDGQVLSLARQSHRALLRDTGLLACAVTSAGSARVHGLLVVQHMDRDHFTATSEVALILLSRELANVLDRRDVDDRRTAVRHDVKEWRAS